MSLGLAGVSAGTGCGEYRVLLLRLDRDPRLRCEWLGAEMLVDRFARAVDDCVVVVQDGRDVGSGEDHSELERELLGVATCGELVGVRVMCDFAQELTLLALVKGDAIAYRSVSSAHLRGGGDEEAPAGEDPLLDVVQVALAQL
jgi:hypothetical protein